MRHLAKTRAPDDVRVAHPAKPKSAMERARRWLFGDDVFISYSRYDGTTYAAGLGDALSAQGLSCQFDQWWTQPGQEMPAALVAALRRSGTLVLVGTPGAAASTHVTDEVRLFLERGRPVVPAIFSGVRLARGRVCKDRRLAPVESGNPEPSLPEGAPQPEPKEALWARDIDGLAAYCEDDEALISGEPASALLNRVQKTVGYWRMRRRQLVASTIVLVVLIALVLASVGFGARATQKALEAKQASKRADSERTLAEKAREQSRLAGLQAKEASDQRDQAGRERATAIGLREKAESDARDAGAAAERLTALADSIQRAESSERVLAASPESALALAVQARELASTPESQRALIRATAAFVPFREVGKKPVRAVHFDPTGSLVALSDPRFTFFNVEVVGLRDRRPARVASDLVELHGVVGFQSPKELLLVVDHSPQLWDVESRWDSSTAGGEPIGDIALSANGERIATLDKDGQTISFWTTKPLRRVGAPIELGGESAPYEARIALIHDDRQLLLVAAKGEVLLVDVASSKLRRVQLSGRINSPLLAPVALPRRGDLLAVPTMANTIDLMSSPDLGKVSAPQECREGRVASVSADGRYLAVGQTGGEVRVCSVKEGALKFERSLAARSVEGLAFSSRGAELLVWGDDSSVIYDAESGVILSRLLGHGRKVQIAVFSPTGEYAVTGFEQGARLWNLDAGRDAERHEALARLGEFSAISVSPDGRFAVAAGKHGGAFGLEVRPNLRAVSLPIGVPDLAGTRWNATSSRVVIPIGGTNPGFFVVDTNTWKCDERKGEVLAVDGQGRVALGPVRGYGDCMMAWDLAKQALPVQLSTCTGPASAIDDLALAPDGALIALTGVDGSREGLTVVERATLRTVLDLRVPTQNLGTGIATFSANGRVVAATRVGSIDSAVTWTIERDAGGYRFVRGPTISEHDVTRITLNDDGRILITLNGGGKARVWDTATGTLIKEIDSKATSAGFSKDPQFPLVLADETAIHRYECRACRPVAELLRRGRANLALARPSN